MKMNIMKMRTIKMSTMVFLIFCGATVLAILAVLIAVAGMAG